MTREFFIDHENFSDLLDGSREEEKIVSNWTWYVDVGDDFAFAMKYLFVDKEIFYEDSL